MAHTTFFPCSGASPSFQDHTLVLPAVSCANVGQLATDLLLFNSAPRAQKVGHFRSRCLLPVVGNDALRRGEDGGGALSTCVEVFQLRQRKLTFLQIRSPVVRGRRKILAEDLLRWARNVGVKEVLVLAGADSSFWTEEQRVHRQIRYLAGAQVPPGKLAELDKLDVVRLEKRKAMRVVEGLEGSEEYPVARGGLLKDLVQGAEEEGMDCVGLVMFCKEGDNIPEGMAMADAANRILRVVEGSEEKGKVRWQAPASWRVIM